MDPGTKLTASNKGSKSPTPPKRHVKGIEYIIC